MVKPTLRVSFAFDPVSHSPNLNINEWDNITKKNVAEICLEHFVGFNNNNGNEEVRNELWRQAVELTKQVRECLEQETEGTAVILESSPVGESQSNGAAEEAGKSIRENGQGIQGRGGGHWHRRRLRHQNDHGSE